MNTDILIHWDESFYDPSSVRKKKPRQNGVTMVIDKGMGYHQFTDFIQTSAEYTDFVKLGFGTSVLYPSTLLQEKIVLSKRYGIDLYPGGTFFEIAFAQGKMEDYFDAVQNWGFETIEISDGSIPLSLADRALAIKKARSYGFKVITECGKKKPGSKLEHEEIKETLLNDLEYGAAYMIVEGRESGQAVGVFDSRGQVSQHEIREIKDGLGSLCQFLIWEAPQKQQQVTFIYRFGIDVNLGNISPDEVYSVEALRRGLRADTLSFVLSKNEQYERN